MGPCSSTKSIRFLQPLQAKLLRAVEERVFEPVGSNKAQPMRARLIVASNRPLEQEVKDGRFRSDLFFRLNVISIELPPLRDRDHESHSRTESRFPCVLLETIATVVCGIDAGGPAGTHCLPVAGKRSRAPERHRAGRRPIGRRNDRIGAIFQARFRSLSTGRANRPTLCFRCPFRSQHTLSSRTESNEEDEIRLITEALERHGNNRRRAAADLGISRMTLYNKLHKYRQGAPGMLYRYSPAMIPS